MLVLVTEVYAMRSYNSWLDKVVTSLAAHSNNTNECKNALPPTLVSNPFTLLSMIMPTRS